MGAVTKNIYNTRVMWIAIALLIIKVICLNIFSSEYFDDLFYPFVRSFISLIGGGISNTDTDAIWLANPWGYYAANNLSQDAFPYHALMLYVLSPFVWLSDLLHIEFIAKTPILFADLLIFFLLIRIFPHQPLNVLFVYFSSIVILYASFVHDQLDIIPTAFCLCGIYFLIVNKNKLSAVLLGCALACKFHIVIVLPLLVFYIYRRLGMKIAIEYLIFSLSILIMFDLPYLHSVAFYDMVIFNHKQNLIFNSFYSIGDNQIFLPIIVICGIYMHFFFQDKVNNDLLFFYIGILFISIVVLVHPAPGWYVWMIPYLCIFVIKNDKNRKILFLFAVFSLLYAIYFILFHKNDHIDVLLFKNILDIKIEKVLLKNMVYTTLIMILLTITYLFYKYGIKSNQIYKNKNILIGIGGDSGSGKSTLLMHIFKLLPQDKTILLEGDGEHKWERGDKRYKSFTHLNPKANFLHKQADMLIMLKNGNKVRRREYDHNTGKFSELRDIEPKKYIFIAGLHPFYLSKSRKAMDIKIYLDIDETLKNKWKIIRDVTQRGYNKNSVLDQINSRVGDADKYILPQKNFADMLIKFYEIDEKNLGLKITIDAGIHIEDIAFQINAQWDYNDDLKTQYIQVESQELLSRIDFTSLACSCIPNIYEVADINLSLSNGYYGLIEVLILKLISESLSKKLNDN